MARPTIILVPGIWEGPTVFDDVAKRLQSHGYSTVSAPLSSTGHPSPGNPTLLDDVQHIRNVIKPLIEKGNEVVLVGHSAGGALGAAAIKDLGFKERAEDGKDGGVIKLVFLTAGLAIEGWRHPDVLPFYKIEVIFPFPLPAQSEYKVAGKRARKRVLKISKGNENNCEDPKLLFSDIPDSVAKSYIAKMQCQPATGWADVIEYAGWKNVPSVYLVCDNDQIMPPNMQLQMATMAGCEIEHCESGHMVMLKIPEKVVEVVRKAAGEKL